ncbi:hypothetical protein KCP73_10565 [Salmonella enterica subsp. enterica]|nr:hypothetical protein KCP73_10565 [Salmonella enterica subsp. enterica]
MKFGRNRRGMRTCLPAKMQTHCVCHLVILNMIARVVKRRIFSCTLSSWVKSGGSVKRLPQNDPQNIPPRATSAATVIYRLLTGSTIVYQITPYDPRHMQPTTPINLLLTIQSVSAC